MDFDVCRENKGKIHPGTAHESSRGGVRSRGVPPLLNLGARCGEMINAKQ